jgi:hypothetical protein
VLVKDKDVSTPTHFISATTAKDIQSSPKGLQVINSRPTISKVPPPHLVPLTQPLSTAISTTSTLTPNTSATTLCNKFLNDKVGHLTRMLSTKYDNALESIESKYQKKFETLLQANNDKMNTMHSKIEKVQEICTHDIQEVRNECLNFQSQFKEQKMMLSSLKDLIVNRNNEDNVKNTYKHLKKKRDKKKQKE